MTERYKEQSKDEQKPSSWTKFKTTASKVYNKVGSAAYNNDWKHPALGKGDLLKKIFGGTLMQLTGIGSLVCGIVKADSQAIDYGNTFLAGGIISRWHFENNINVKKQAYTDRQRIDALEQKVAEYEQ